MQNVTIQQLAEGLQVYIVNHVVPHMDGPNWQKHIAVACSAIVRAKAEEILSGAKESNVVQLLGLIDETGNIDIEAACTAIKESIRTVGPLEIPAGFMGEFALSADDITKLYHCICPTATV